MKSWAICNKIVVLLVFMTTCLLALSPTICSYEFLPKNDILVFADDFVSIQSAISSVEEGGTVIVRTGIHYENVVVPKSVKLIGEKAGEVVIDGGRKDSVIKIKSNNVYMKDLILTNSDENGSGVFIKNSKNITIENCKTSQNGYGFRFDNSDQLKISNNDIIENQFSGMYISSGYKCEITNNSITLNLRGVSSSYSPSLNLENNIITDNQIGIEIFQSEQVSIEDNLVKSNAEGIGLTYCEGARITGNIVTENTIGINLYKSKFNRIFKNDIYKNEQRNINAINAIEIVPLNWWGNAFGPDSSIFKINSIIITFPWLFWSISST